MRDLARRPVVLLDAGGTLIGIDYDRVRIAIRSTGLEPDDEALDVAEARARRWADAAVRERLGARGLWDGYFARVLRTVGVDEADIVPAVERLWEMHHELGLWRRPLPFALETVEKLARAGKRLAVVSNAEGQVEGDLREAGFARHLETVVDSHVVGVAKPDPRIFAIALERIGCSVQDALYVGDVPAYDVVGARAAGMPVVLIDRHAVHDDVDCPRIRSIRELPGVLGLGTA